MQVIRMKRLMFGLLVGFGLFSLGKVRASKREVKPMSFKHQLVACSMVGTVIPTVVYHGLNYFKWFRVPYVKQVPLGNGRRLTVTFRMNEIAARCTIPVIFTIISLKVNEKFKSHIINFAVVLLTYWVGEVIHATVPTDNWASRALRKIAPNCFGKYCNHVPVYVLRSVVYGSGSLVSKQFDKKISPYWDLLRGNIIGGWDRK